MYGILNKSIVSCLVLTIAFDLHKEAIKMVWYSHILKNFPEFAVIHTGKDFDAGRDWGQEEKVTTEDEMAGWYH